MVAVISFLYMESLETKKELSELSKSVKGSNITKCCLKLGNKKSLPRLEFNVFCGIRMKGFK